MSCLILFSFVPLVDTQTCDVVVQFEDAHCDGICQEGLPRGRHASICGHPQEEVAGSCGEDAVCSHPLLFPTEVTVSVPAHTM